MRDTNWRNILVTSFINLIIIVGVGSFIKYSFDKKLEQIKPLTAEETLRRENYLNSKLQTYYEAVDLACRWMACQPWTGPDIPKDRVPQTNMPIESEMNLCRAKITLFADDSMVVLALDKCLDKGATVITLGEFIDLLRKDMGYGASVIPPDRYLYIFRRMPGSE